MSKSWPHLRAGKFAELSSCLVPLTSLFLPERSLETFRCNIHEIYLGGIRNANSYTLSTARSLRLLDMLCKLVLVVPNQLR